MNELPFHRRPMRYRLYNATLTLIIINVGIYLLTLLFRGTLVVSEWGVRYPLLYYYLSLIPIRVIRDRAVWQVLTYMFMHGSSWHILINMMILFIFGTPVERRLGSGEFLLYYLLTGIGAGLVTLVVYWYTGLAPVSVLGASGAVFALLLAFATLFPNDRILVFLVLPMRAPYAVMLFAGLELIYLLGGSRSGVANLTHLAGLLFGLLYFPLRLGVNPIRVFFNRR